jgi:hypothetical protein
LILLPPDAASPTSSADLLRHRVPFVLVAGGDGPSSLRRTELEAARTEAVFLLEADLRVRERARRTNPPT